MLQPGISSIQDAGRFGYLSEGIPTAGFMDSNAAELANMLVGNSINEACVEWGMLPPKLEFKNTAVIALTGAVVKVYLNGEEVPRNKRINVPENSLLSFGRLERGVYGYIAIQKGFQTEVVLGSRSWFDQITTYKMFNKGLMIPFFKQVVTKRAKSRLVFKENTFSKISLDAYPGPEFNLLTKDQQSLLMKSEFTVNANRNRMGVKLSELFDNHHFNVLSSPVLPGTVQWTPSGGLIVLMRDAQTIGGYPRVLQLTENAMLKLSNFNFIIKFNVFL